MNNQMKNKGETKSEAHISEYGKEWMWLSI